MSDAGVLAASGLVAGEGRVGGLAGDVTVASVILLACAFLWVAGRTSRKAASANGPRGMMRG